MINDTPTSHARDRLLVLVASVGLVGLGLAFAVIAIAAPDILDAIYALAGPGHHTHLGDDGRFGAGIYAAMMVGWGVHTVLSARGVSLVNAFTAGALAWYIVDSVASLCTGYPMNVLSNTGFLLVIIPIWLSACRARRGAKGPRT